MTATFPVAEVPLVDAPLPDPTPAPFVALVEAPDGDAQFLVEITAYIGGRTATGGVAAMAEIPLMALPETGSDDVGEVVLRYSDKPWVGSPTDTEKPNIYYEGRVQTPLRVERLMPVVPEEARRVQRQFGEVEINNSDGALDSIVQNHAVNGRQVRILIGPAMGAYAEFGEIANLVATRWTGDIDTVRLSLRDRSFNLELPLQENLYGGSGGADGTAEIEGKSKPQAYGRLRNITPILIDPVNLIYQWHDGAVFAVDDIFDRGAALTSSGSDVADYTALVSESVSLGQYATANAVGMFKLGGVPDGLLTLDGRGDATPDYADTFDVIALRVLLVKAGIAAQYVDSASFAGVAALGGEMGIYIHPDERPTTADVLDRLLSGVGGWWGASRRGGRIRAGRLTAPETRTPTVYLTEDDILEITEVPVSLPRWRHRRTYQPNWTPQRGEDLASSVTAARRQFLVEEQRVVVKADSGVRARHRQALDEPPSASLYENETHAQTLADAEFALHSVDRRGFDVRIGRKAFLRDLQSIVRITYGRLGLATGQNFAVIGIRDEAFNTSIRVWG